MHVLHSIVLAMLPAMPGVLVFSRYLSECSSSFRLACNLWIFSPIYQLCIASSKQKAYQFLTTKFIKKIIKYDKSLKSNFKLKLLDPLRSSRSTLMELWQLSWNLVSLNILTFIVPCHIRSPHHVNLTWNSLFSCVVIGRESVVSNCASQGFPTIICVDSHSSHFMHLCDVMCTYHAPYPSLGCPHVWLMHCLVSYSPYHCFKNTITQNWVYQLARGETVGQVFLWWFWQRPS